MRQVYLDYAAATPMDGTVLDSMKPYFIDRFYNPSANYLPAKAVRDDIIQAKKNIAAHLGVRHGELIHTSGGTESNNLTISGVMESFPGKNMLVSSIEHESVLKPAEKYEAGLIPVDATGTVDIGVLKGMISDKTVLISVMLVNNETGAIQPIKEIASIIREKRKARKTKNIELPLYLHADACQAACYLDINATRLGVDMMSLNGGKIYGPKQSGMLMARPAVNLRPQILGGAQQRNLRSGTENPAAVIGFAKALDVAVQKRSTETSRIEELRTRFIRSILEHKPEIIINGSSKKHTPHIASVTFPGVDNERLLFQLEEKGILVAAGSACSASSEKPSHVLGAMGLEDEAARSSLRFSFGRQTSPEDIEYTAKTLISLLA